MAVIILCTTAVLGALIAILFRFFSNENTRLYALFDAFNRITIQKQHRIQPHGELAEEDFASFPVPVRKYLAANHYYGASSMLYLDMECHHVDYAPYPNCPSTKTSYSQYIYTCSPARSVYMRFIRHGIPYETHGYFADSFSEQVCTIGRLFEYLYLDTDEHLDRPHLTAYLAQCLFIPSSILNGSIQFMPIDDYHAEAVVTCIGTSARGIFTFNEQYELVRFDSNDSSLFYVDQNTLRRKVKRKKNPLSFYFSDKYRRRPYNSLPDIQHYPWTVTYSDYRTWPNGLRQPGHMTVTWHYPDHDFIYFDGPISNYTYVSHQDIAAAKTKQKTR